MVPKFQIQGTDLGNEEGRDRPSNFDNYLALLPFDHDSSSQKPSKWEVVIEVNREYPPE